MLCDVCSASVPPGTGERIPPEIFTYLLDNGFGLDETALKMLTDTGMSRSEAEAALKLQYRSSTSEWLLCSQCIAKAVTILSRQRESWVSDEYLAVTKTAQEVGLGYDIIGAPVALSRAVWTDYVEWTDQDSEQQTYQEQDTRLWDVLFTGGGTLQVRINQFEKERVHRYTVQCIPRDGVSIDAVTVKLLMRPTLIRGQHWLVIEKA